MYYNYKLKTTDTLETFTKRHNIELNKPFAPIFYKKKATYNLMSAILDLAKKFNLEVKPSYIREGKFLNDLRITLTRKEV